MHCPSTNFHEIAWLSGGPPKPAGFLDGFPRKGFTSLCLFKKMPGSSVGFQENELLLDEIFNDTLCFSIDLSNTVVFLDGISRKCVVSLWVFKHMLCFAMNFKENVMCSLWMFRKCCISLMDFQKTVMFLHGFSRKRIAPLCSCSRKCCVSR